MKKKIFVTYGNSNYYKSLKRIAKEAKTSGEFDEIFIFTDKELPEEITSHELFQYKRGGGYWLWKPYICLKVLERCDESDIVVYSDCGNKIYRHNQWNCFFEKMENYKGIFFYHGAVMDKWCRKSLIKKYKDSIPCIGYMYQLQSGFFIFSKRCQSIMEEWYKVMRNHPEFVIDASQLEKKYESPYFIESRHDQSVLSCVVYDNWDKDIWVTRQRSERYHRRGQAVFNARISDDSVRSTIKYEPIHILILRLFLIVPYREAKMKLFHLITHLYKSCFSN